MVKTKKKEKIKKKKSTKQQEELVWLDNPKFDAAVLKILVEHFEAIKELAK